EQDSSQAIKQVKDNAEFSRDDGIDVIGCNVLRSSASCVAVISRSDLCDTLKVVAETPY
ncbi:uncharacterized, partial [Tachysurus ichikawai]